ncbi:piggyBac transposable element-derived protein 4-like [Uloborus diversus]|uniref:piggyBac transposable element-derived protein 4-like n=1 Tax=Uloborus diversus TaxID=327109 RepID=UPI00240995C3|nr:piggyBac transposable element-derived protein 4-like [Uloborus diversus]
MDDSLLLDSSDEENSSYDSDGNSYESDFDDSQSDSESDSSDILSNARDWCKISKNDVLQPPPPPRFPFTGSPGLKERIQNAADPMEYFNIFFSDDIVEHIACETNRYAKDYLNDVTLKPHSRANKWKPTSPEEIRVLLAIFIIQSIVQKPKESLFWTRRTSIETPFFRNVIPQKRYYLLTKFLHFVNNDAASEEFPEPKLKKIWPIFEHLGKKFSTAYIPDRDISIDESLMKFRGRLSWIQFIPTKRARFGIKFFVLSESASGYVWKLTVYVGKTTLFDEEFKDRNLATKSVLTLIKPLLNQGYCLITDNFYTSPELFEELINHKTDAYGTEH